MTTPIKLTTSGGFSNFKTGDFLPVEFGGTGGTTQVAAQTALGLLIGTNVVGYSASLEAIRTLTPVNNRIAYYTGATTAALATITAFTLTLLDDSSDVEARTTLGLTIGTNVQAFDADLSAIAALATTGFAVRTADNTWALRTFSGGTDVTITNGTGVAGNVTIALGSGVAKLNVEDQNLTGGVIVASKDLGTISSGTVTPDPGDRPMQHYTNNGAHTLAPSVNSGSILLDITNGASAGAITTSGFTKVVGSFTTTNGNKFRCHISIGNGGSLLSIQALQ